MLVHSFDYDSDKYEPAAPVVEIAVSSISSDEEEIILTALVDSGADATVLPIDIIEKAGARFIETRHMRGVTGYGLTVDTYLVQLRIGPHKLYGIQSVGMLESMEAGSVAMYSISLRCA